MNTFLIELGEAYVQGILTDEKKRIVDYFAFSSDTCLGNIYSGRVENVRGSQCFVNYGCEKNGILTAKKGTFKVGDYIKCKVEREPVGDKGAVLSRELSLSGRFSVVGDNIRGTKFSSKLTASQKNMLKELPLKDCIVRRSAADAVSEAEIVADYEKLVGKYEELSRKNEYKISCIYAQSPFERLASELYVPSDVRTVVSAPIESMDEFYLLAKGLFKNAERYDGSVPAIDALGLRKSYLEIFERRVSYSGIELVFDETEALTVVDVNASSSMGMDIGEINRRAAVKIAEQVQLRNYGGIILVDFISSRDDADIVSYLQELFGGDRERVRVSALGDISLIAINRKKRYNTFNKLFFYDCKCCNGSGTAARA